MYKAVGQALLIFTFSMCVAVHATELSEKSITKMLESLKDASTNQDIERLGDLLADDVKIMINILNNGETQTVEMDKDDYMMSIGRGWSLFEDYDYDRNDVKITIHDDHAVVESTIHEKISIQGQIIEQSSREKSIVRLIGGRARLTRIEGTVEM